MCTFTVISPWGAMFAINTPTFQVTGEAGFISGLTLPFSPLFCFIDAFTFTDVESVYVLANRVCLDGDSGEYSIK